MVKHEYIQQAEEKSSLSYDLYNAGFLWLIV